jgi:glycine betaine/proline transport system substrate-binding protein
MKKLLASTCVHSRPVRRRIGGKCCRMRQRDDRQHEWQSAEVLSNLDKFILNEGYGCEAEITVGDTVPTITSMAEKGQPDIAPEAWIDLLPDVVKKGTQEGKDRKGRLSSAGWRQSGLVDSEICLADAHPDIKTIPDLLKHPELFPDEEDSKQGRNLQRSSGVGRHRRHLAALQGVWRRKG